MSCFTYNPNIFSLYVGQKPKIFFLKGWNKENFEVFFFFLRHYSNQSIDYQNSWQFFFFDDQLIVTAVLDYLNCGCMRYFTIVSRCQLIHSQIEELAGVLLSGAPVDRVGNTTKKAKSVYSLGVCHIYNIFTN